MTDMCVCLCVTTLVLIGLNQLRPTNSPSPEWSPPKQDGSRISTRWIPSISGSNSQLHTVAESRSISHLASLSLAMFSVGHHDFSSRPGLMHSWMMSPGHRRIAWPSQRRRLTRRASWKEEIPHRLQTSESVINCCQRTGRIRCKQWWSKTSCLHKFLAIFDHVSLQ